MNHTMTRILMALVMFSASVHAQSEYHLRYGTNTVGATNLFTRIVFPSTGFTLAATNIANTKVLTVTALGGSGGGIDGTNDTLLGSIFNSGTINNSTASNLTVLGNFSPTNGALFAVPNLASVLAAGSDAEFGVVTNLQTINSLGGNFNILGNQNGDSMIGLGEQKSFNAAVWTDWNADLLDGLHASAFLTNGGHTLTINGVSYTAQNGSNYTWTISGSGGDVYTASNNVMTGVNTFSNLTVDGASSLISPLQTFAAHGVSLRFTNGTPVGYFIEGAGAEDIAGLYDTGAEVALQSFPGSGRSLLLSSDTGTILVSGNSFTNVNKINGITPASWLTNGGVVLTINGVSYSTRNGSNFTWTITAASQDSFATNSSTATNALALGNLSAGSWSNFVNSKTDLGTVSNNFLVASGTNGSISAVFTGINAIAYFGNTGRLTNTASYTTNILSSITLTNTGNAAGLVNGSGATWGIGTNATPTSFIVVGRTNNTALLASNTFHQVAYQQQFDVEGSGFAFDPSTGDITNLVAGVVEVTQCTGYIGNTAGSIWNSYLFTNGVMHSTFGYTRYNAGGAGSPVLTGSTVLRVGANVRLGLYAINTTSTGTITGGSGGYTNTFTRVQVRFLHP